MSRPHTSILNLLSPSRSLMNPIATTATAPDKILMTSTMRGTRQRGSGGSLAT